MSGQVIDGKDIRALWSGVPGATSPHEAFYYYMADQLQAVRCGQWKLHLPLQTIRGKPVNRPLRLIDLDADPEEVRDLAGWHPEMVQRLLALSEKVRVELGDLDRPGWGLRPGRSRGPAHAPDAREIDLKRDRIEYRFRLGPSYFQPMSGWHRQGPRALAMVARTGNSPSPSSEDST